MIATSDILNKELEQKEKKLIEEKDKLKEKLIDKEVNKKYNKTKPLIRGPAITKKNRQRRDDEN